MQAVVLGSGDGGDLAAILAATAQGLLPGLNIMGVLSSRPEARILELAHRHGISAETRPVRHYPSRQAYEKDVRAWIRKTEASWVLLCGYRYLLSSNLVGDFEGRIVNSHPSLLPAFPGLVRKEIMLADSGKFLGASVHLVDSGVDTGEILAQAVWPKKTNLSLEMALRDFRFVQDVLYVRALRGLMGMGNIDEASPMRAFIFSPGLDRSMMTFAEGRL